MGAALSALATAVFLFLDVRNFLGSDSPWQYSALVSLAVFVVIMSGYNWALRTKRPSFTVALDPEGQYVRLLIENHGGAGEFEATGQLVEEERLAGSPWNVQWRGKADKPWAKIAGGNGQGILNVASRDHDAHGDPIIVLHTAEMTVPSATGVTDRIYRYFLPPTTTEQEIEIAIRSDPEPIPPWRRFKRRYRIRLTLRDITMDELG